LAIAATPPTRTETKTPVAAACEGDPSPTRVVARTSRVQRDGWWRVTGALPWLRPEDATMNVVNEKPAQPLDDSHPEHDNQRSSNRWSPWLRAPVSKSAGLQTPAELGDASSSNSG
jgi:hypothetical protein